MPARPPLLNPVPTSIPSFNCISLIVSGNSSGFFNAWFNTLKYSVFSFPCRLGSTASSLNILVISLPVIPYCSTAAKPCPAPFSKACCRLINPNDFRLGLQDGDGVPGVPDGYNLYIGVDTKTGMHAHIEDDFMLNQIVGKKKIYFLDFEHLNIKPFWSKYQNFSRENFFRMNWDKMDIYYAELEPGDSVCIPPWWWHAVESDGYSIGMTKVYERDEGGYYYRYEFAFPNPIMSIDSLSSSGSIDHLVDIKLYPVHFKAEIDFIKQQLNK